jgi:hypothetical protein
MQQRVTATADGVEHGAGVHEFGGEGALPLVDLGSALHLQVAACELLLR